MMLILNKGMITSLVPVATTGISFSLVSQVSEQTCRLRFDPKPLAITVNRLIYHPCLAARY